MARTLRSGWLVLLALGCDGGAPAPPPSAAALDEQVVVARVGEQVIGVDDVRRYVSAHGVTPREALRALEDQALLVAEARRQGWHPEDSAARQRADEQLLGQRVLLDLERDHPLDGPSQQQVEAYYAEHTGEIVRDEQRDCVQVLVEVPAGATEAQDQLARAYAEEVLTQMRAEGVNAVWSNQPPEHDGLRVLSQYLPTAAPTTDMPEEFRRLIFGLSAPGPTSEPTRTESGWHAVAVTAIHPPIPAGSPRALEVARERLVTVQRGRALNALLLRLVERYPVSVSRDAVEAVLPALGDLLGPAT